MRRVSSILSDGHEDLVTDVSLTRWVELDDSVVLYQVRGLSVAFSKMVYLLFEGGDQMLSRTLMVC